MKIHTHLQAPHCLDQPTLEEALTLAEGLPLRDTPSDSRLAAEHVRTLFGLGGPATLTELHTELRSVSCPSLLLYVCSYVSSWGSVMSYTLSIFHDSLPEELTDKVICQP